jgi:hypothetical protein
MSTSRGALPIPNVYKPDFDPHGRAAKFKIDEIAESIRVDSQFVASLR